MKLPFVRSRARAAKTDADGATPHGVVLSPGLTGSRLFVEVLAEGARRFPRVLGGVRLPDDQGTFKQSFPEVLVRYEAHRAASAERVEVARALAAALRERLFFRDGDRLVPLAEHLIDDARAHEPGLRAIGGRGEPRGEVVIPWRGATYGGADGVDAIAEAMRGAHLMTDDARRGLGWVARERLGATAAGLDLRGERFALLGAGAELAPTELLLAAGAEVLWIDRAPPPERLRGGDYAGRLWVMDGDGACDLLATPERARQAIIALSRAGDGAPVHLGLYAYAPGKGRELRLAAAMDAIARSLPRGVVRSVALLVSPTTPGEVQPEDRAAAEGRRSRAARWKRTLERAGLLPPNAHEVVGDVAIARSIVSLQGAAYQAAQYLAKMMAAEAMLADGIAGAPVAVSANVAGITATRSLLHPLFQAAFLGAPHFGIEIYEPATTRLVSGLLMLHDVLHDRAPGAPQAGDVPASEQAGRARRLAAQTVHGGCRALPWVLEPTIRVGAVLGLGKRPGLLKGLVPKARARR